jgi:hypothetical protein
VTHSILLLIIDALAVFRLTHLVTEDTILEPVRELLRGVSYENGRDEGGFREKVAKRPSLAIWVTCPWCVSPWCATVVVAAQSIFPHIWFYPACVLAFSAVTGLIATEL